MMVNSLIEATLEEISRDYQPGALVWMKANRPNDWGNMLTLERRINRSDLESDLRSLREVLSEYRELIFAMVKEYKALKENKGQGTLDFQGRKEMK
jgi:hypothetical protein